MRVGIIYKIKFKGSDNYYIGSTLNPRKRKEVHIRKLIKCNHDNIILQKAFNKYGIENFIFEKQIDVEASFIRTLEQWYLDFYKPKYNINKSATTGQPITKINLNNYNSIINDYINTNISIEELSSNYKIGKAVISRILNNSYDREGFRLTEKQLSDIQQKKTNKFIISKSASIPYETVCNIKYILDCDIYTTLSISKYYKIDKRIITNIKNNKSYKKYPIIKPNILPNELIKKGVKSTSIKIDLFIDNITKNYDSATLCAKDNNFNISGFQAAVQKRNNIYKDISFKIYDVKN